jgi:hypothetical protein
MVSLEEERFTVEGRTAAQENNRMATQFLRNAQLALDPAHRGRRSIRDSRPQKTRNSTWAYLYDGCTERTSAMIAGVS